MRGSTWTVIVMLALLAGCAAPPPADEAPAGPDAAPSGSQTTASDDGRPIAEESFESGDAETLTQAGPSETPTAAHGN